VDLSSGFKSLLIQFGSWMAVTAMAVFGFMHYDSIRASLDGALGGKALPAVSTLPGQPQRDAADTHSDGTVELRSGRNGHYEARVDINGRALPVMVDTGASLVVLTYEDAQAAGVYVKPSDFTQPVSTANGTSRVAPVTLRQVSIGDITVRNVQAAVADRGLLKQTLLGMSFLSRLQRVDMRDGVMVLKD